MSETQPNLFTELGRQIPPTIRHQPKMPFEWSDHDAESAIHYGVIGTNWITEAWIAAGLPPEADYPWRCTAVYSRDQAKAQAFADKHGARATYTSVDDLAADKDIKAVYIASPNSLHYSHAKTCLKAKKHVVLEKPATSTHAELKELYALADENKVLLLEAFRHIWENNFFHLEEAVPALGQVYGATLGYCSFSSRYNKVLAGESPPPNTFSLEYSGGALVDVGVYPISFAVALWGKPKSVSYTPFICPTGADGAGFGVLQYDTFAVQISCSKVWTTENGPCEIYGENGKLVLNAVADIDSIKFHNRKSGKTLELSGQQEHEALNLSDEARALGCIIKDFEDDRMEQDEAARVRRISLTVSSITEEMRRQGGIVFAADR